MQQVELTLWYTPIAHNHYKLTEEKIGHINSFFELEAEDIDKNTIKFDTFKGQVTVITNVASYCGKLYILFMCNMIMN